MRRILTLTTLACLVFMLVAPAWSAPQPERRVALVIGNGAYKTAPLKNPANDARDMAAALKSVGFEVIERENASLRQMNEAIDQFWGSLKKGGVGLFFFAGHGLQVSGENYLVPVDARVAMEQDVQYECVNAGKVLGRMENAGNGLNIVILDACRNNPFARSFRGESRGLAKMDAPTGSLVAFATAPGDVAADGAGKNGLYTSHLLRVLRTPGLKIEDVLKQVRIGVASDSAKMGKRQTPWESSSLMGDFYFKPGAGQAAPAPAAVAFPSAAPQASPQLDMGTAPKEPPAPATEPKVGDTWVDPVTGMELKWVPGGEYEMGCGPWAGDCGDDEKPLHSVRVNGFWLGKYEVTNGQFRRFRPGHKSVEAVTFGALFSGKPQNGDRQPAVSVSWNDAWAFAQWLSGQGVGKLRLPTEAEWEYAARSGGLPETYAGGRDPDQVAWHDGNSGASSHEVGTMAPNGLGLHDMSGNVWEWCADVYDKNAYASHAKENPVRPGGEGPPRVRRGGSWYQGLKHIRTACRAADAASYKDGATGFRLVREQASAAAATASTLPPAVQAAVLMPAAAPQPAAHDALANRFAGRYAVAPGPSKTPGPLVLEFDVKDGQLVGTPSGGGSATRPVGITNIRLQGNVLSFRYSYKLVVFGIAKDGYTDFTGELGGDLSATPFRFVTHDGNLRDGWLVRLP
ncbi:MAG: SUMF1/EgtB/PvdO family nonheme iron enzyme [Proteobacteria bacterium]|nr:SUMF1/EgtB/PvdO family nonheme iron enzyme [Pseudomonadota bacterium]MBU1595579.1 SUMF1/EgtB/PvdO family nonheme iron enzyme [Pseudomonadota bacterium]